jgi:hypothetical protein
MAKEKEQEQEQQVATGTAAPESPVILRAKSREELDQQFQDLKAKHEGNILIAGAVARSKDDGTYILRVDII